MNVAETQVTIATIANNYGIPIDLATNIARQESGFQQSAVSSVGAIGVMQLMPSTARELGVNPNDPFQNIEGGLRYLKQLYNQFGDWKVATAAYNAGPGRISQVVNGQSTLPSETKGYLRAIWGDSSLNQVAGDETYTVNPTSPALADSADMVGTMTYGNSTNLSNDYLSNLGFQYENLTSASGEWKMYLGLGVIGYLLLKWFR